MRNGDSDMMTPPPVKYPRRRHRRGRARAAQAPPAPPALVLVAASYAGLEMTLAFDRAIDIAGLVGAQIVVDDAVEAGLRYAGTGAAVLVGPAAVVIELV